MTIRGYLGSVVLGASLALWALPVGVLSVADSARAGDGEVKVTICHTAGNGKRVELTLGQPGAENHLETHELDTPGKCWTYCDEAADCGDGHACLDGACVPTAPCPQDQQAIADAISEGGAVFACDQPTTVTTTSEIVFGNNAILGGLEKMTLEGNGSHRVVRVPDGITGEILGVTISGGGGVDYGGAIYNEGTLTLTDVSLTGNTATLGGGDIYTTGSGTLTMRGGTSSTCQDPDNPPDKGGFAYLDDGDAVFEDMELRGFCANNGGVFYVGPNGALTLNNVSVEGNTANRNGGGIYVAATGSLALNDSKLHQNTAVGISGGGIANNGGTVSLTNSTVSRNSAGQQGGGIYTSFGTLTLTNSTVSGNSAEQGGGVHVYAFTTPSQTPIQLIHSTFARNTATDSGPGIYSLGTMTLRNTLIADGCDSLGAVVSEGHNIESPNDTCGLDPASGDMVGVTVEELQLSDLQNNGGPTLTHAPRGESRAINALDCAAAGSPATDQRGIDRPQPANGLCDVGAVEVGVTYACTEQGIRDAIAAGGGPLTFACAGPPIWGNSVYTQDEIVIDNDVILDGEGLLIVDAHSAHRVFSVASGVTAELVGMTVRRGSAGWGGGILNEGTLTLMNSTVIWNEATSYYYLNGGGGIFNRGTLTLSNSTVSDNVAAALGGGIYSYAWDGPTALILDNSKVSGNQAGFAGGIASFEETAILRSGSEVSDNAAAAAGGGIYTSLGILLLTDSFVLRNDVNPALCPECVSEDRVGGGGILNDGSDVELLRTEVSWNRALSQGVGGGIVNGSLTGSRESSMTITDSTISNNVAEGDGTVAEGVQMGSGGGIINFLEIGAVGATSLLLTNTTVSDNAGSADGGRGGGVANYRADVELNNVDLIGNEASAGGGVYNRGDALISQGLVSENSAYTGGGIFNDANAVLTVDQASVSGNQAEEGGGLYNANQGTLSVLGTTVSHNQAYDGGGIHNKGLLAVIQSTVGPGNLGAVACGGVRDFGGDFQLSSSFVNSTISGNLGNIPGLCANGMTHLSFVTVSEDGVGIGNGGGSFSGIVRFQSSLIRTACEPGFAYQSYGNNMESPGATCQLLPPADWPGMTETELNLDLNLADNGGPTKTHALLPGSEAIDWIEWDFCSHTLGGPATNDQRGEPRPVHPSGMCDVGAFELQP